MKNNDDDPPGDNNPLGAMVVIPLSAFDDLRRKSEALERLREGKHQRVPGRKYRKRPTSIERDAEVVEFIRGFPATAFQTEIHRACVEKFGASRAPSRSALNRYILRLEHEKPFQ